RNQWALIVATGCYAERSPAEVGDIEGVGLVVGNRDKEQLLEMVTARDKANKACGWSDRWQKPQLRTRGLVKIQDGCSQPCSFCIVPRVRGREQSWPQSEVIADIKAKVDEGYNEVVLTGTRIGSYDDGGLQGLIMRILNETHVSRLRLSSLEPGDITPEFLKVWENDRCCPHIHLPLQSGSDSVLERMRRSYSSADYERAVSLAREAIHDLALTTDVMVGFPDESEKEFEESYRFCELIGFARMHVFPYSARPSTPAAKMADRVEGCVKRERSKIMIAMAQKSAQRFRQQFLGQSTSVLWERESGGVWVGHSDNYLKVFSSSKEPLHNCLLVTKLVREHNDGLWGESDAKVVCQNY
ncbi:MAG: MiaB/RimO family radical SAM methylthiotransferase, partial [Deltaproteobacteria bacterium]|nr:MiaB/RimO family radical SAM methylthiotransferase [Deltaproteobacteria bacterium]